MSARAFRNPRFLLGDRRTRRNLAVKLFDLLAVLTAGAMSPAMTTVTLLGP